MRAAFHLCGVISIGVSGIACSDSGAPAEPYFLSINQDSVVVLEGGIAEFRAGTNVSSNEYGLITWTLLNVQLPEGAPAHLTFGAEELHSPTDHRSVKIHTFLPGRAELVAHFPHLNPSDTALLVVLPEELGSIDLTPSDTVLSPGESFDFFFEQRSVTGRNLFRYDVDWTLSDSTVATLEVLPQNGFSTGFIRLTAVQPGQVDVGVTVGPEGLSTAATVIVEGSDDR